MYRIEDNIYSRERPPYGKSLFAKKNFKKDEIVFVAFGAIVTKPTDYTIPIDWNVFIEPRVPTGNLCQYICHSCEPNLGIKDRSLFVAMCDIKKDEEVTIDYGMLGYEYGDELPQEERMCKCGATTCRMKLGCYKELPADLKEKYKGYISDFLLRSKPL